MCVSFKHLGHVVLAHTEHAGSVDSYRVGAYGTSPSIMALPCWEFASALSRTSWGWFGLPAESVSAGGRGAVCAALTLPCGAGVVLEQGWVAQVLDSLIASLAKHTSLLNPAMPQASIAFGADELSCMATETMFELASRCATAHGALCCLSTVF